MLVIKPFPFLSDEAECERLLTEALTGDLLDEHITSMRTRPDGWADPDVVERELDLIDWAGEVRRRAGLWV